MTVKMIYCLYEDSTRDIQSNIPLRLKEFPWALPSGTPSGKGVYLTIYPSSRPYSDTVHSHGVVLAYTSPRACIVEYTLLGVLFKKKLNMS